HTETYGGRGFCYALTARAEPGCLPLSFRMNFTRDQDQSMPRAYWKGYLRLSLVTCPIELFPATSQSEKTHFHQINTQTGHRLRQQMVDEETGRPRCRFRT